MMLRAGWRHVLYLLFSTFITLALGAQLARAATTQTAPDWFADQTPAAQKLVDLQAAVHPQLSNVDCTPITIQLHTEVGGQANTQADCAVSSPIGQVTMGGHIITDGENAYKLSGNSSRAIIWPGPDATKLAQLTSSTSSAGSYLAFYSSIHRDDAVKGLTGNGTYASAYYYIDKAPDTSLKADGSSLPINPEAMAYSSNGRWLVVDLPRQALLRVDLQTMQIFPFGDSIEPSWNVGVQGAQLAISDDGRYVAVSQNVTGEVVVNLFDLSDCTGHITGTTLPGASECRHRDIWQGQHAATGRGSDMGVGSELPTVTTAGNLRFIDDGNLVFNAEYDAVSKTDFKAASFVVRAAGAEEHDLGLLGMGDSYISGEGEFQYVPGTDTDINKCHLSKLSYPYLLGDANFPSVQSVACSGAKAVDIVYGDPAKYKGQVTDGTKLSDRDRNQILDMFSPGYTFQDQFSQTYQPQAILLSIGGNNIGFADIIKSCITGVTDNTTCYADYQDRLELLNLMDSTFGQLVDTYTDIKNSSPTSRIYVVGYPQIVKPDGDCADNVHLNAAETEFAAQLVTDFDNIIHRAATRAGVVYVDTQHALDGHRLCEGKPGDMAMNGFTVGNDSGITVPGLNTTLNFIGQESYHPTVLGHQLLAASIDAQTDHLTAAMPAADTSVAEPAVSPDDPLLANLPPVSGNPLAVIADDDANNDYVRTGASVLLNLEGLEYNLSPYGIFHLVLHSDPVDMGATVSDADGNLSTTITIPPDTKPGLHTIHITGKDFGGNPVDIQKQIYVYDPNHPAYAGYCQVVPDSGHDVDEDGIDDACDPDIGLPPASAAPAKSSPISAGQTTAPHPLQVTPTPTLPIALVSTQNDQGLPTAVTQIAMTDDSTSVLGASTTSNTQKVVASAVKPSGTPHSVSRWINIAGAIVIGLSVGAYVRRLVIE